MHHPSDRKSNLRAIASFVLGLAFWVPLLNLIFSALSIYLGATALLKIRQHPNQYGGKGFAVAGIALGSIAYLTFFTGLSMCLVGYKEICKSIGLQFFA